LHPYQILTSFIAGGDAWVRQYQLLQERKDRIVLRVLPAESPGPDRIARIEHSVAGLLGAGVQFQVQLVSDLPLDANGKFRPCRSLALTEPTNTSPAHVPA
ncbi:MAG: hypothetical protein ACRDF6_12300, partial [bacterium]